MVIVTSSVLFHGPEWTDILARDQLKRRDCAQRPQTCRRFACRVFAGWPVDRVVRPACLRSRSHSISGSPMSRRCDGVLGSADLTDPPSGRARPRAGRGAQTSCQGVRVPESQVRNGLPAGGNRIRTFGPPWRHQSPTQPGFAFGRQLGRLHGACALDRWAGMPPRDDFVEVFLEADCFLDFHQGALVHFRSWPGASPTRAPRGGGSGTGLALRAWRAFRFRRTAASRISRAPRLRPYDSLTSSRGRAPQLSRSIRMHRSARCEPRRCAAVSLFSYRRPDCAAASRSSIRAVFRRTRSKMPQACHEATGGQRRWLSLTYQGSRPSSAALLRSHAMGGAAARAKATATWNSPSCASSVTRRCLSPRPCTICWWSPPCPATPLISRSVYSR